MRIKTAVAIALLAALPAVRAAGADPTPKAPPKPASAAKPPAGSDQSRYHLKPGAKGKVCVGCHSDFQDVLKQPFVHTPVKNGECSDCHNPHASDHGKLLAESPSKICLTCHAGIVPEKARSVHRNVLEGNCVKCHDPHGAKNKGNLRTGGNDLCLGCHADIAKGLSEAKFKHSPVGKSCLTCHDPHAGATTDRLLTNQVPGLCVGCHKPENPAFQKAHLSYPVAKADCTSCHDPHGSSQSSILWATVHAPVRNRMCTQCHNDASSPDAVKTKRSGVDLCRACHSDTVNAVFNDSRVHWPVLDRTACLNCHNPHAARAAKLLKADEKTLCGRCHADAVARQDRSETKHEPIADGNCTICHRPHSSSSAFLLDQGGVPDVCGGCHDWGKHSTHPVGPKVIDPRNRNLTVSCLSCHRTHGTSFKHLAHFDTKKDLCVQCHEEKGM